MPKGPKGKKGLRRASVDPGEFLLDRFYTEGERLTLAVVWALHAFDLLGSLEVHLISKVPPIVLLGPGNEILLRERVFEAFHAWLNEDLFSPFLIVKGLRDQYLAVFSDKGAQEFFLRESSEGQPVEELARELWQKLHATNPPPEHFLKWARKLAPPPSSEPEPDQPPAAA